MGSLKRVTPCSAVEIKSDGTEILSVNAFIDNGNVIDLGTDLIPLIATE